MYVKKTEITEEKNCMSDIFNRLNDRYSKYLYNQERKDIAIDLINAVFADEGCELISDAVFTGGDLRPRYEGDKEGFLDVLATTSSGEKIDIEIQIHNVDAMVSRSLYYDNAAGKPMTLVVG